MAPGLPTRRSSCEKSGPAEAKAKVEVNADMAAARDGRRAAAILLGLRSSAAIIMSSAARPDLLPAEALLGAPD